MKKSAIVFTITSIILNTTIANQPVLAKSIKPQTCNIYAYVTETDPQGLNVRTGSTTKHKILGKIPQNATIKISANLGEWVQINNASEGFKGTGWVYIKKVGLSTRGYKYKKVNIYNNPNSQSRKIGTIPENKPVQLLGCQSDWAQVQYKTNNQTIKGWLKREDQCGAALTTCS